MQNEGDLRHLDAMADNAPVPPVPSHVVDSVSAAFDIWAAFSSWLKIMEDTLGGLEAGRTMNYADDKARKTVSAAVRSSRWSSELSRFIEVFDRASGFVEKWTDVGEPPRGTGGAYLRMSVLDAREALQQLAGFLFAQLRLVVNDTSSA
jgi:hypothetical protein